MKFRIKAHLSSTLRETLEGLDLIRSHDLTLDIRVQLWLHRGTKCQAELASYGCQKRGVGHVAG